MSRQHARFDGEIRERRELEIAVLHDRAVRRIGLLRLIRQSSPGECSIGRCIAQRAAPKSARRENEQDFAHAQSAQPAADFCRRRRKTVISFSTCRSPRWCAMPMPSLVRGDRSGAVAALVECLAEHFPRRRYPASNAIASRSAVPHRSHRRAQATPCRAKNAAARRRAGRRAARAGARSGPHSWRLLAITQAPKPSAYHRAPRDFLQPSFAYASSRRWMSCVVTPISRGGGTKNSGRARVRVMSSTPPVQCSRIAPAPNA